MISVKKLFLLIFIPAAAIMLAGAAFLENRLTGLTETHFRNMLATQWQIIADIASDNRYTPEFHRRLQDITDRTALRISFITPQGEVITDSGLPYETLEMTEDHSQREEVRSALLGEPMLSVRYSRSTATHTAYYARLLPDGNVLRLAYPAEYYDEYRGTNLIKDLALSFLLLILIALVFAMLAASRYNRALRDLEKAVDNIDRQDGSLLSFNNPEIDKMVGRLKLFYNRLQEEKSKKDIAVSSRSYIMDHCAEGIFITNGDGRIVAYNKKAADILGTPLPDYLNDITDVELIRLFGKIEKHSQAADFQTEYRDKLLNINMATYDAHKIVIISDISAGASYQDYKMDLIGNLSHELKTPLTLILGASETILKDKEMPKAVMEKFLGTIYRNGNRLNELLNDMLILHKLENTNGKALSSPETTSMEELLHELEELTGRYMDGKKVIYRVAPQEVNIAPAHMLSIMSNLINNALKYSDGPLVEASVQRTSSGLVIEVADQGPLIAAEERERIFERFYSTSASRTREGRPESGSGLGLSIVKHISRLYKGTVSVVPNTEGGNTFRVEVLEK